MAYLETANLNKKFNNGPRTVFGKVVKTALDANTAIAAPVGSVAGGIVGTVLGGPAGTSVGSAIGGGLGKLSAMASQNVSNSLYKAEGGLIEYNSGGTHEENPNGGIPVGSTGLPSTNPKALVEEGETVNNGYVFSNRLLSDSGKTFADESKAIKKRYIKRLGKDLKGKDVIAAKSLNTELLDLQQKQELLKASITPQNQQQQLQSNQGLPQAAFGLDLPSASDTDIAGAVAEGSSGGAGGGASSDAGLEGFMNGAGAKSSYIGYGIQALSRVPDLIKSFGAPDKVHYDRITPELVDYSADREALKGVRNLSTGIIKRNAGMAGNAGQAMNYLAGAVPGIQNNYYANFAKSLQTENNVNAQLRNDAMAKNAYIAMQEAEVNAQEKDAMRTMQTNALSGIGSAVSSALQVRPELAKQYALLNTQAATNNYQMVVDEKGNISYKYVGNNQNNNNKESKP